MIEHSCSKSGCQNIAKVEVIVSYVEADFSGVRQVLHPVNPHLCLEHAKMMNDYPIFRPTILYKPIKQKEEQQL